MQWSGPLVDPTFIEDWSIYRTAHFYADVSGECTIYRLLTVISTSFDISSANILDGVGMRYCLEVD